MAAIVIGGNARARWFTGLAGLRARACDTARRAAVFAAATVMACAIGAALLQLAVELLSFSAPIAAAGLTVMTATLLRSLRRSLGTRAAVSGRAPRLLRYDRG